MHVSELKFHQLYLLGFFIIVALPLLSAPPLFFPPAYGKVVVFRTITAFILFLFICELLSQSVQERFLGSFSINKQVKTIFNLLLGLFFIFLLATIFSIDPNFSFWDSPYRGGGLLNLAFYILFAFLAFFVISKKDWKKIFNFAIGIAFIVSIIAVLQNFNIFSDVLIPYTYRPIATLGNPVFLAVYLLLLSFIALAFGIKEKDKKKQLFYFLALGFMLYTILVTETRAAYLGFLAGICYFILFFPQKTERIKKTKKVFLGLLILGILAFLVIKINPQLFATNIYPLQRIITRISSISLDAGQGRISGWKITLQAIKEKPLFGWGPGNFSIGFDKYYDPSLPKITTSFGGGWWDKAHNIILDYTASAGIFAPIIYIFLFASLFLGLQKAKTKLTDQALIIHALQSAFLAYFLANLFGFDTFSTSMTSFLFISFSLSLINSGNASEIQQEKSEKTIFSFFKKYSQIVILVCLILLILFACFFNLKHLQINKQINQASYYSESEYKGCKRSLGLLDEILETEDHTPLDHYLCLRYIDIVSQCVKSEPESRLNFAVKAIPVLQQAVKIRPTHTRTWLFLAGFTNILLEEDKNLTPEQKEILKNKAVSYIKEAYNLSPKRREILSEWTRTYLLADEYENALQKAQECIDANPDEPKCFWLRGMAYLYLDELKKGKQDVQIAIEKGYDFHSIPDLLQLATFYSKLATKTGQKQDYQDLAEIYEALIKLHPENPQYHATIAYAYKELGEYEKARIEAEIVLKLSPQSAPNVEQFLKTLPAD